MWFLMRDAADAHHASWTAAEQADIEAMARRIDHDQAMVQEFLEAGDDQDHAIVYVSNELKLAGASMAPGSSDWFEQSDDEEGIRTTYMAWVASAPDKPSTATDPFALVLATAPSASTSLAATRLATWLEVVRQSGERTDPGGALDLLLVAAHGPEDPSTAIQRLLREVPIDRCRGVFILGALSSANYTFMDDAVLAFGGDRSEQLESIVASDEQVIDLDAQIVKDADGTSWLARLDYPALLFRSTWNGKETDYVLKTRLAARTLRVANLVSLWRTSNRELALRETRPSSPALIRTLSEFARRRWYGLQGPAFRSWVEKAEASSDRPHPRAYSSLQREIVELLRNKN